MMRYSLLAGLFVLSACHTALPPPPSQYSVTAPAGPVALRFAAASAELSGVQVRNLRALSLQIPATTFVDLAISGEPVQRRAQRVAHLLQRDVHIIIQPGMPVDEALVSVPGSAAITADACRRRAQGNPEDFWPGDDHAGGLFLPSGCATAMSIAAQTTAPTDLIVGRPLPPGAALPYAQAIERYYRRNDAAKKQEQPDEEGSAGDSSTAAAGMGGSSGAASAPAGNPLLGGVPAAPAH